MHIQCAHALCCMSHRDHKSLLWHCGTSSLNVAIIITLELGLWFSSSRFPDFVVYHLWLKNKKNKQPKQTDMPQCTNSPLPVKHVSSLKVCFISQNNYFELMNILNCHEILINGSIIHSFSHIRCLSRSWNKGIFLILKSQS